MPLTKRRGNETHGETATATRKVREREREKKNKRGRFSGRVRAARFMSNVCVSESCCHVFASEWLGLMRSFMTCDGRLIFFMKVRRASLHNTARSGFHGREIVRL